MKIRFTTERTVVDWHNRPRARSNAELGDGGGEPARLPGMDSATKYRVVWEVDRRLCQALLAKVEEALGDETLHEAKRESLERTLIAVTEALKTLEGRNV